MNWGAKKASYRAILSSVLRDSTPLKCPGKLGDLTDDSLIYMRLCDQGREPAEALGQRPLGGKLLPS